jgi:uncharacterized protein (UPF0276 family)
VAAEAAIDPGMRRKSAMNKERAKTTAFGVGSGWRPELARYLELRPMIAPLEVVAENFSLDRRLPSSLLRSIEHGTPIFLHGIGLSLGSAEGIDPVRAQFLAEQKRRFRAVIVSEHVAFVRAGGREVGHLFPLPRTRVAADVVVDNLKRAEDIIGQAIAIENISALFEWPDAEMSPADFLATIAERSGAPLLLDLANLHADRVNFGVDPARFLADLPIDRVAYLHVAGGYASRGLWHDTHAHAVTREIFELFEFFTATYGPRPTILERDGGFGSADATDAEFAVLRDVLDRATIASAEK